jgi:hypothetical protein
MSKLTASEHGGRIPSTVELRFRQFFELTEFIFGLLFAGLLLVLLAVGGACFVLNAWLYQHPQPSSRDLIAMAVFWLVGTVCEVFAFRRIWIITPGVQSVPAAKSLAMAVILRPPPAPLLRPLIALWWLLNAGAIVFMGHWFTRDFALTNPTRAELLFVQGLRLFVIFCASYASNIHIAIAVNSSGASPRAVQGLWRCRILIDLAVAGAFAILPLPA